MGGIHGVATAVIKEIADVVSPEYLDQAFVFGRIFIQPLQFVAGGTKRSAGCVFQSGNRVCTFATGVDKVFGQGANDAVSTGVHLCDLFMLACGFDNAAGRGVDDGGDAAGLCVKCVLADHMNL